MFKGIIWHTVGKALFLLSSYAIHFFLGKALSPAEYGIIGTIITILDFDYLFLNNGVRQSISKTLAGGMYDKRDVVLKGILFQSILLILIFTVNYFGAPVIANILGDGTLEKYIKYAALIIPFTGIYFAGLGVFNGLQIFTLEAGIVSVYPILKLAVIPLVAFVFSNPIIGTEAGFLFAAIAICAVTLYFLVRKRRLYPSGGQKINFCRYAKNAMSYSLLFSIVSVIMNMDTLVVKAVTGNDALVGYYTGAATFSKVPYYLLAAFYLVVLPIIAENYEKKQIEQARRSVGELMSIILALILPIVAVLCGSSYAVLSSFYKPEYAVAGPALTLLVLGIFCLGMTLVFCMIISAAGKERFTNLLAIFLLLAYAILSIFLTGQFSIIGTALANLICTVTAMFVSCRYAFKIFGKFLERKHYMIILVSAAMYLVTLGLFALLPRVKLPLLAAIYLALYFGGIELLNILGLFHWKKALSIVKKEKKANE